MSPQNLEVIIHDAYQAQWLRFSQPVKIFNISKHDRIIPSLVEIDRIVNQQNKYAAGFVSYEAAPAFDAVLQTHPSAGFPLLCFGIYNQPELLEISPMNDTIARNLSWYPDIGPDDYNKIIKSVKEYIRQGWTYQVNYTFRLNSETHINPAGLFNLIVRSGQARYGAYINHDNYTICSASPELFFKLDGRTITSIPMKGTAPRGMTLEGDERLRRQLQHSQKDRAENVMIVDMIRNDLSRVCEYGSVNVRELFRVEKYPTIWQMVSEVIGKTDAGLDEIFKALFPCASITGAPKIKTMSLIRELERSPRQIYTGTIGMLQPGRKAQFNVAIRTLLLDKKKEKWQYGVGSGIVWDSSAQNEYSECILKSRVLQSFYPSFELLETMLVEQNKTIFLLDYHLKRMRNSALYFDIAFDQAIVKTKILDFVKANIKTPCVLRILLNQSGKLCIQKRILFSNAASGPVKLALALEPVKKDNIYLYHKTTHREIYEQAKMDFPDHDDVILWNEQSEITESTIANIVLIEHGRFYTPTVACGLLNGTYRQWLIDHDILSEKVLSVAELKQSESIFLINSVRKWRRAILS